MASDSAISWANVMRVGLGSLQLSPKVFWSMSLPEFRCAASGSLGSSTVGFGKSQLDDLSKSYPDEVKNESFE